MNLMEIRMEFKLELGKNAELENIPTDSIERNPDNPRTIFRSEELESLLLSISQMGIQVPITVYKEEDRYFLIDGERRWKCAKKLNLKTIPALVQEKPTRLQNLLLMFNIHSLREQWDILTIAMKLPSIIDLLVEEGFDPSERSLAKYTGLSQGTIRRSKLLMKLPEPYRDMILQELKKPKSKQKLTEDFFIEMERSLQTVNRYLPTAIKDKNSVREVLINKYLNGTISNILHFRDISRIARAEKLGVASGRSQQVLEKVFEDNDYSVERAFRDSAEWAYDERDFTNKINWLLENLQIHEKKIADSAEIKETLMRLQNEIAKLLRKGK